MLARTLRQHCPPAPLDKNKRNTECVWSEEEMATFGELVLETSRNAIIYGKQQPSYGISGQNW